MSQRPFYGREEELSILREEFKKNSPSLVVIHGRRRIGKSRLIDELGRKMQMIHLSGLPPTRKTTHQAQRNEFSLQLSKILKLPQFQSKDWTELFWLLSRETQKGRWIVVLDEISWMGSKDPDFLGKLKNAWDLHFSKNPQLMLILCGSVSSWIEENILSNTGFLGRISIDLLLKELPLNDCIKFWKEAGKRIAPYEFFKVLSVTGGVPKYLEEIIPAQSAEENIKRLCFTPQGLLFREFDQIFSDLFSSRNESYRNVVQLLVNGPLTLDEIAERLKLEKGGSISRFLIDLEEAGFLSIDGTWNIKTKKISTLRKYRLSDNYLRFYLKYISPVKYVISQNQKAVQDLSTMPAWNTIMGLQFENLVIANRDLLYKILGIHSVDVLLANPFFQRPNKRQAGCQIDFMIQTKYQILYLCEMKFSQSKIGHKVANEMQEKIKRLFLPKGMSIRTVLIHVNGISDDLYESGVFDHIIDFGQLLQIQ